MQSNNSHPQAQRLDDLLRLVGQVRPDDKSKKLTAFLGLRGSNRQGLLMIVGQAPYGWAGGHLPSEFQKERVRREMIDRVVEKTDDLAGVAERNRKSRFWQVAEKVATQMISRPSEDGHWTTEISYSNLFKVARAEGRSKNPTQGLRLLQQPLCVRILIHEILLWRPSRILFMTGL